MTSRTKTRIEVLTPTYGHGVHAEFALSLVETRALYRSVRWRSLACSDVSLGRNILLGQFLAGGADVALWLDADQSWTVDDFVAVTTPVELGELDVVSAFVQRKAPGPPIYASQFRPEDIDAERGFVGEARNVFGQLYSRLWRAGCGFVAVSRRAVIAASELVPKFDMTSVGMAGVTGPWLYSSGVDELSRPIGEDQQATVTLARAGFPPWGANAARVVHHDGATAYGGVPVDVDDFARRCAKARDARLERERQQGAAQ